MRTQSSLPKTLYDSNARDPTARVGQLETGRRCHCRCDRRRCHCRCDRCRHARRMAKGEEGFAPITRHPPPPSLAAMP